MRNSLHEIVAKTEADDDSFGGRVVGHDTEFGNIISYYMLRDHITTITLLPCSETEDLHADYYIISPYVKHNIVESDTVIHYQPSELLLLRSNQSLLMQTVAASEINRQEKTVLNNVDKKIEVFRFTLNDSDSVYIRVDLQMQLQFSRKHAQSLFQFWHERDSAVVWGGYYYIASMNDNLSGVHCVNRNFPFKATAGDVIKICMLLEDSTCVPIEISQIRAHLQVAK